MFELETSLGNLIHQLLPAAAGAMMFAAPIAMTSPSTSAAYVAAISQPNQTPASDTWHADFVFAENAMRSLRTELGLTKKLIDALAAEKERDASLSKYLFRAGEALDSSTLSIASQHAMINAANALANRLRVARDDLLQEVGSLEQWLRLATALSGKDVHPIPDRFVVFEREAEIDLDVAAVRVAANMPDLVLE